MAIDANINRIKFLRSTTSGNKPTISTIEDGELALNFADRTIYSRIDNNIVELGFGKGGVVAGDISAPSNNIRSKFLGAIGGSDGGNAQGAWLGWNKNNGQGRTDFINNKGQGGGGFDFWNGTASTNMVLVASIDANGNYSKNANTATTLQTARTITLSGDANGSVSFNGGSDVTLDSQIRNKIISNSDDSWKTAFRTNFDVPATGRAFIAGYRTNFNDSISAAHGSNLAWGVSDTHSFLNVSYDNSNAVYIGAGNGNKINWSRQVAFVDSNVSSATKLQTPRNIWGQSFDGTNNITGDFATNSNIRLNADNSMIAVGNNQDIALVKKHGAAGKFAIGASNSFTVTKSNNSTINPSDTFTDLFSIGNSGVVSLINDLSYTKSGFNANLSINTSGAYLQLKNSSGVETAVLRGFNDGNGDQLNLKTGGINTVGNIKANGGNFSGSISTALDATVAGTMTSQTVRTTTLVAQGQTTLNGELVVNAKGSLGALSVAGAATFDSSIQVTMSSEANAFKKLIYANTTTDGGYLAVGNEGSDKGYVELGTVDDAETAIYARKRNSESNSNSIYAEAKILGFDNTTSFPVSVTSPSFIGKLTGTSDFSQLVLVQERTPINTGRLSSAFEVKKVYNDGYPNTYGNVLNIGGDGQSQFFIPWSGSSAPNPKLRSLSDVTSTWSDWMTLAYTTDNVASATKLQTSRNINGVAFDGTKDIEVFTFRNGLEIFAGTPYIDFHFNNSNSDYTSRIHEESSGVLTISNQLKVFGTLTAASTNVTGDLSVTGKIDAKSTLSIPNNSWAFNVGDDAIFGDRNVANHLCIKGISGTGGIAFFNGDTQVANIQGAFYSGNSASATKLASSRTLWGQSFNGTADVNGNLTSNGTIQGASLISTGNISGVNLTATGNANISGTITGLSGLIQTDTNHYIDMGKASVDRMNFGVYSGTFNFIDTQTGSIGVTISRNNITTNNGTITTADVRANGWVYSNRYVSSTGDGAPAEFVGNLTGTANKTKSVVMPNEFDTIKPIAQWIGAVCKNRAITVVGVDANNVYFDTTFGTSLFRNNIAVGSIAHIAYRDNFHLNPTFNATITSITYNQNNNQNTIRVYANWPNHGIDAGNMSNLALVAYTYSAVGCSYDGSIAQRVKLDQDYYSYLLKLSNYSIPKGKGNVQISTANDVGNYNSTYDITWMADNNPLCASALMVKPDTCNFVVSDNNQDNASASDYVSISIWE